jgi:hypothetical protein
MGEDRVLEHRIKTPRLKFQGGISEGCSVPGGDDRIRTGDEGFADPCLTTWRRRRDGAGDGIRTRDLLLGKEMLYP